MKLKLLFKLIFDFFEKKKKHFSVITLNIYGNFELSCKSNRIYFLNEFFFSFSGNRQWPGLNDELLPAARILAMDIAEAANKIFKKMLNKN